MAGKADTHILHCSSPGCFLKNENSHICYESPAEVFKSLGFGAVGEEKVSPRLHVGCVQETVIPMQCLC